MPRLYFGSRGGVYYKRKGRKVYVTNRFGSSDDERRSSVASTISNGSSISSDDMIEKLKNNENLTKQVKEDITKIETMLLCLTEESKDEDLNEICKKYIGMDTERIKTIISKLSQWNKWKNERTTNRIFPDLTTDFLNRLYFLEILEKAAVIICILSYNLDITTRENLNTFVKEVREDINKIYKSIENEKEDVKGLINYPPVDAPDEMIEELKGIIKQELKDIQNENEDVLERCAAIKKSLKCVNLNSFGYYY